MKSLIRLFYISAILCLVFGCADRNVFFPIGLYTNTSSEALSDAREAGFNSIHIYSTDPEELKQLVSKARGLGLRALIYPGDSPMRNRKYNWSKVISFVRHFKNDRAILAWYMIDEPDVVGLRADALRYLHIYLKKLSPKIPTTFVVSSGAANWKYQNCSDIVMVDWYPIPHLPVASIEENILQCIESADGKPVWMVIQAFDWSFFSEKSEKETGRCPTFDELRCMSYLAIVCGAKGIFYWTYGSENGTFYIKRLPMLWRDLKKVVKELNCIYPLLIAEKSEESIKIRVDNDETDPDYSAAVRGLVKELSQKDIRYAQSILLKQSADAKQDYGALKPGKYLIAVNPMPKGFFALFEGLLPLEQRLFVLFEERTIAVHNGQFCDHFQPYQVHIYFLGSKETRKDWSL